MSAGKEAALPLAGRRAGHPPCSWTLEVGGQRYRCILDRSDGIYAAQMRVGRQWVNVRRMRDPLKWLVSLGFGVKGEGE